MQPTQKLIPKYSNIFFAQILKKVFSKGTQPTPTQIQTSVICPYIEHIVNHNSSHCHFAFGLRELESMGRILLFNYSHVSLNKDYISYSSLQLSVCI